MDCARVFRALGDRSRLCIVQCLLERRCCISELHKRVGTTQPNISQHIAYLQRAGIVKVVHRGKMRECRLANPRAIRKLIQYAERV
ncbi:MAG: metalloregulator ArsR/SmtB family transcription factor [Candidatus Micrarchaeia archaeon]